MRKCILYSLRKWLPRYSQNYKIYKFYLYINLINKKILIPEEIDKKFMKIPLIAFVKLGILKSSDNFVIVAIFSCNCSSNLLFTDNK